MHQLIVVTFKICVICEKRSLITKHWNVFVCATLLASHHFFLNRLNVCLKEFLLQEMNICVSLHRFTNIVAIRNVNMKHLFPSNLHISGFIDVVNLSKKHLTLTSLISCIGVINHKRFARNSAVYFKVRLVLISFC